MKDLFILIISGVFILCFIFYFVYLYIDSEKKIKRKKEIYSKITDKGEYHKN